MRILLLFTRHVGKQKKFFRPLATLEICRLLASTHSHSRQHLSNSITVLVISVGSQYDGLAIAYDKRAGGGVRSSFFMVLELCHYV